MTEQYLTPSASQEKETVPNRVGYKSKHTQTYRKNNSLVAVIYVGQNNCVFTIYTAPDLKFLVSAEQELDTNSPQPGWYEQDPKQIIEAVYECSYHGCKRLPSYGYIRSDIEALGVTNQRETIVVWDGRTGEPLYKAILGHDRRATSITEDIIFKLPKGDFNYYKPICGLPVLPYFPALKIRWLQENVPAVKIAMKGGYCKVGTLDTWVVWKLTKGVLHVTDVTNASRTLLMNISTLDWDESLLKMFSIKPAILPEIRSCAESFGAITAECFVLKGIRIGGIIADQQAAMLGQMCMHKGQTIANFDGSLSLMCNTGKRKVPSRELLTVVAYKLGAKAPCIYALEGNVPYCGNALKWLHNKLRLVPNVEDVEDYASVVSSPNDVFFVPALTGLHAPYWRRDARGVLIGLTEKTTRAHIVRAALEAICFQACDILEAVKLTGEYYQNVIYAGGKHAKKTLLMQMLADLTGASVVQYECIDSVSYGAAICAGNTMNVVNLQRFEQGIWRMSIDFDTYIPLNRSDQRIVTYVKWRRAVSRSLQWVPVKKRPGFLARSKNYILLGSLFSGVLIASVALFVLKTGKGAALFSSLQNIKIF